jgi:hypothetical protein
MEQSEQVYRLELSDQSYYHLVTIRKWAFFLAIMAFIGCGMMLLFGLFFGFLGSLVPEAEGLSQLPGALMMAIYCGMGVVYFFPAYFLLNFASRLKTALSTHNSDVLTDALKYLKYEFTFFGVGAIVGIAFTLLAIVFAVGVGIFAGMNAN